MRQFGIVIMFLLLAACEDGNRDGQAPPLQRTAPDDPTAAGSPRTPSAADLQIGERVYLQACATCHRDGIAGAMKMGDKEAWQPSIAKGMPTLVRHSIEGFQGNRGVMPPKGGVKSLTDEEVAAAVAYMVQQNR